MKRPAPTALLVLQATIVLMFAFAVAAVAPASAAAAPGPLTTGNGVWQWLNPVPAGNELWAVDFISADTGWVAGSAGTILRTSDSGTTWESVGPRRAEWIFGLSFLDTSEGWAVGDKGVIWHTTDGGDTWARQDAGTAAKLLDVAFVNPTDGWACGQSGAALRTTNGGATWTDVSSGLVGEAATVFASSKDEAWVGGEVGIRHTTDGGATWADPTLPGGIGVPIDLTFTSPGNGWAVTDGYYPDGGEILATTDGGQSWQLNATPSGYGLSAIAFRTPSIGWTCGESGVIYTTTDAGATWDSQGSSWGYRLWDIAATTATVWAVGREGGIVKSTDSGASWGHETTGPQHYYYDVDVLDDGLTGWAGGMSGAVIRTLDGGLTWSETPVPPDDINGVSALSAAEMWGVGDYSVIVHTTDGGANWTKLAWDGGTGQLEDVDFADQTHGWAVGVGSRLLHYNGATWAAQDSGTQYVWFSGVDFVDAANGWVVGGGGAIVHTTDGGASWQQQTSASGYDLNDVFAIDANKAVAVADVGDIIYTTDAGATWHKSAYTPGSGANDLHGVAFADAVNGWAAGSFGLAVRTTDGGLTWTSQSTGASAWFEDVAAAPFPAPQMWAVGRDSAVMTVPAALETTAPVTTDDGPAAGTWSKSSVTVHLTAADAGSGVQVTAVSTDGGTYWSQRDEITIAADPAGHATDGASVVRYASTDNAGNCEAVKTCTVNIDTRPPGARATRSASVTRGRYVRLYYRANDAAPNAGTATVTIRVKTLGGTTVKTITLKNRPVNRELSYRFRCTLARRTYRYWVSVVDAAGNRDLTPASNRLVVR